MNRLPIEDVLPELRAALSQKSVALVTAPPGAGKTTGVPLALLDAPWLAGRKILLLEPRRLAARAAAQRLATILREAVGATVGYRMRMDSKVGPATRVEVVTEGVLTRLLIGDPALEGYGAILFDEFHERSLQGDTGLALALETHRLIRPDLRLLVMSATLDCGPVSELLGGAPVVSCSGRMFPVETRYLNRPLTGPRETAVVHCIRRSLTQDTGSLLVFLPGMAEIRRVERTLLEAGLGGNVVVAPLHGDLPQEAQDQAIEPPKPGSRKVVLATSIAETSLTIDGIRVVIDAGQVRTPRFDPGSGLTRLETIRVTQDSADQRRGRAGRLEPGICYRLWTEQEHQTLLARRLPEILEADLCPLLLETAQWGVSDPLELSWLTPPPSGAVAQARDLLLQLGALDRAGRLTAHGRQMGELSLHPRLADMLLQSAVLESSALACELAALLSERDILRSGPVRQADVRLRLDVLHGSGSPVLGASVDRRMVDRIKRATHQMQGQLQRLAGVRPPRRPSNLDDVGLLLAFAYPDRIAQRQTGGEGRYLLANGRGALFAHPDPLAAHSYLVIPELDAGSSSARIDLAAPVSRDDIERLYAGDIVASEAVAWDDRTGAVRASRQRRLGALVLSEESLSQPDPSLIASALLNGVRKAGLHQLAWTPELQDWRMRVRFLRRANRAEDAWPDVSDEHLLDTLDEWLGPYVIGMTTLDRVRRMDLSPALHALLTPAQERELKRLAPTHLSVPSGSQIRLDYSDEIPILAVRLQEMFGCKDSPRVLNGAVPVLLHLLSPAKRPVQVTKDLASFWVNAYPEVRKELRGRYPKHHWPEDPLAAPPTAKTKRRS